MVLQLITSTPAISVCIPTFNRCARLEQVLKKLLQSDFSNFEIVISDNCSTDGTSEMVRKIGDSRVKFVCQKKNLGALANWNAVTLMAGAPVIFRLDSDDYVSTNFLRAASTFLERNPQVGSCYSRYVYTKKYDESVDIDIVDRGLFAGRSIVSSNEFLKAFLLHDPFPGIHPSGVVYRRELAERIGFYRPEFSDHTFSLALATQAPVGYFPEATFFYVQHDEARASNCELSTGEYYYNPLNLAEQVYKSPFDFFNQNQELQKIRGDVYDRHVKLYSCIELYTARRNFGSRRMVVQISFRLLKNYPQLYWHPPFFGVLLAMLGPAKLVDLLLNVYRNSKWFQKMVH